MIEVTKVFDILSDLTGKDGGLNVTISDRWNTFYSFKLLWRIFLEIYFKLTGSGSSGRCQKGLLVFEGFLFGFDVF